MSNLVACRAVAQAKTCSGDGACPEHVEWLSGTDLVRGLVTGLLPYWCLEA